MTQTCLKRDTSLSNRKVSLTTAPGSSRGSFVLTEPHRSASYLQPSPLIVTRSWSMVYSILLIFDSTLIISPSDSPPLKVAVTGQLSAAGLLYATARG